MSRSNERREVIFGRHVSGEGEIAKTIKTLHDMCKKKHGLDRKMPEISSAAFRRSGDSESSPQLDLFADQNT